MKSLREPTRVASPSRPGPSGLAATLAFALATAACGGDTPSKDGASPPQHAVSPTATYGTPTVKETELLKLPHGADPSTLAVSRDGKHVAFAVRRDDGYHAVIDGKEGGAFEVVTFQSSEDGRRHAVLGDRQRQKFVVVDGTEHGPLGHVWDLAFSADGATWACVWRKLDGTEWIVVDGKETATHAEVARVHVSPTGRVRAIVKRVGSSEFALVEDGKPDGPAERGASFSRDGEHLVWSSRAAENETYAVVDGKRVGQPWKRVYAPRLSHDGKRLVFIAVVGDDENCAVIDGKAGKTYKRLNLLDPPEFSPDGGHVSYPASYADDKRVMVRDASEGPKFDHVLQGTFSPDGSRFAYLGSRRAGGTSRARLVLDGVETGEAYERVGLLALAADGSHVGLFAWREGGWRPSIDGLEVLAPGGAYEQALAEVTFDSQNSFHGFAVRAGTLYRVDVAR